MRLRDLLVPAAVVLAGGARSPASGQEARAAEQEAVTKQFVGHYELAVDESFRPHGQVGGVD